MFLAEMIPALTVATGKKLVPDTNSRFQDQFNMHMVFKNLPYWPEERLSSPLIDDWLHGDLKDISYLYVHELFEKFVELGALKDN